MSTPYRIAFTVACLGAWGVLVLCLLSGGPAQAQVFYPDDPLMEDPDRAPIDPPQSWELSDFHDYVENAVERPDERGGRAMNINTLGEVPRSSWYEPGHYYDRMSIEELQRGPHVSGGPNPAETWQVVEGKEEGVTTGFWVEDSDHRYLLKFDDKEHLELSTASEAIVTQIFHALGYHSPENYLVHFGRDQLEVHSDATFEDEDGEERPMTTEDLEAVLGEVPQYEDGTFRALASQFLPGEYVGPFKFHGTRPDDPNDIFPHEHRRELRGMRVFSAWVNRGDARSNNTLDMLLEGPEGPYVKHFMIDHTTTLGATPLGPQQVWMGREFLIDAPAIAASVFSLGLAGRPWTRQSYPNSGLSSVGHFRTDTFEPTEWKQQYRNPAFLNMDEDDAFWAAKQVAHFTAEEIRGLVRVGEYTREEAIDFLTEALIVRRDKIARAYLPHGGGLDRFRVGDDGRLQFDDLLEHPAFEETKPLAPVVWHTFDNATGQRGVAVDTTAIADGTTAMPAAEGSFVVGVFHRTGAPDRTTEVFLRAESDGWAVVGLRRSSQGLPGDVPVWTQVPDHLQSNPDSSDALFTTDRP